MTPRFRMVLLKCTVLCWAGRLGNCEEWSGVGVLSSSHHRHLEFDHVLVLVPARGARGG